MMIIDLSLNTLSLNTLVPNGKRLAEGSFTVEDETIRLRSLPM
jgi:hypothetical protein